MYEMLQGIEIIISEQQIANLMNQGINIMSEHFGLEIGEDNCVTEIEHQEELTNKVTEKLTYIPIDNLDSISLQAGNYRIINGKVYLIKRII